MLDETEGFYDSKPRSRRERFRRWADGEDIREAIKEWDEWIGILSEEPIIGDPRTTLEWYKK